MTIWVTALRLALESLWAYKVRSLLTMLGIIIGIGSVIVMIGVGRGAKANIQEQISSLGSNMLMVFSGSSRSGGVRGGFGTKPTLKVNDAEAIVRECPAVSEVTYSVVRSMQIVSGNSNWGTSRSGHNPRISSCSKLAYPGRRVHKRPPPQVRRQRCRAGFSGSGKPFRIREQCGRAKNPN